MIQPKPFKFLCEQCGYSKVVKPKSDALNPMDMINTCPKCKSKMEKVDLNIVDKIFG